VAVGDGGDGFRLLLLNQARRRDFAESFATEVIPLRSGRHNLEKIGRRGWKPRAIKAKSKRRTRVSDPHVTSRGRGRPRHIFIMRSSSLLGSWVRAGRFPAPCAEAMARRVVLVEADRDCARGFDKVLGSQHGGSHFGNLSSRTDFGRPHFWDSGSWLCELKRLRRPLPTGSSEGASCLGQPHSVAENATRAAYWRIPRSFRGRPAAKRLGMA